MVGCHRDYISQRSSVRTNVGECENYFLDVRMANLNVAFMIKHQMDGIDFYLCLLFLLLSKNILQKVSGNVIRRIANDIKRFGSSTTFSSTGRDTCYRHRTNSRGKSAASMETNFPSKHRDITNDGSCEAVKSLSNKILTHARANLRFALPLKFRKSLTGLTKQL